MSPADDLTAAVSPNSVSDLAAQTDSLGFDTYVSALSAFLLHPDTQPPITISIEGPWGSGKSSFMHMLEASLTKAGANTVWFNAWRHNKDEELWAAFAVLFTRKLAHNVSPLKRFYLHLKLSALRFNWSKGWFALARFVVLSALFLFLGFKTLPYVFASEAPATTQSTPEASKNLLWRLLLGGGGLSASLVLAFALLKQISDVGGNPLEIKLSKYMRDPKYETREAFIETLQSDLELLVRTYANGKKVFVFVDDLDRCDVPKATELMQAVNLLISEVAPVFYIVGVDREKVAAGIAAKYKDLLPYLPARSVDPTDANILGLEFGYNFLEKFIQIPFILPRPTLGDLDRFLDTLGKATGPANAPQPSRPLPVDRGLLVRLSADSAEVREVVRMAASALDLNPRRIKHFLNLFRLRAFLSSQTGLFGTPEDVEKYDPLTLEQLGKLVAISVRWPLFFSDLEQDHGLLARLYDSASGNKTGGLATAEEQYWERKTALMELLAFPLLPGEGHPGEGFRLNRVDVARFLRVGRTIPEPDATARTESPEPAPPTADDEDFEERPPRTSQAAESPAPAAFPREKVSKAAPARPRATKK